MTALILAALGAKAFYFLYLWLASAWIAGELSRRKGYGEKWGLGTGLILSAIGVIIWLIVPARPNSIWKERGWRRAKAERVEPGA
jgi:hypothetical protein